MLQECMLRSSMALASKDLPIGSHLQQSTSWVKAGYWSPDNGLPASEINSALFTHLICYAASLNSSTFRVHICPSAQQPFSTFTATVKTSNPSVTTLLCISLENDDSASISSMMSHPPHRKSFIESSIETARLYGFRGLELEGYVPEIPSEAANLEVLLDEWRAAVSSEATDSGQPPLMLTLAVNYVPVPCTAVYPIDSMRRNLDWVQVVAYNYHRPSSSSVNSTTHVHAALYEPLSQLTVDFAVGSWISRGLPEKKLVLGLAYHGFAWTLVNPDRENGIGAAASGPAVSPHGNMGYKYIKGLMRSHGVASSYDDAYASNYCSFGETWIGYDDVEAISAKVSYAKEKGLLGFLAWDISYDENWVLSLAAAAIYNDH